MGQHIAPARDPFSESTLTVMEIPRSVENELRYIVSGHSILNKHTLDVSRIILSRDVLLLLSINAVPDDGCSTILASD